MSTVTHGQNISVHQLNIYFQEVTVMLLEHFDLPKYAGSVFILGDYVYHPASYFKTLYPSRRIIIYQLEQMVGSVTWHSTEDVIRNIREADEIWDYDYLNVEYLSWYGIHVHRVVPMLYTNALRKIQNNLKQDIDVLFYGYINERRYKILHSLQRAMYNRSSIVWLYGVIGETLDTYIARSKIILNLHAFEPWHRQEQVRMFYPVINNKLVVSETSQRNYFGNCIVEANENNIGQTLLHYLQDDNWIQKSSGIGEEFKRITNERLKTSSK